MEVSHREQIGRSLESLGQALYPYLEQKLKVHYGESWDKKVLSKLQEPQQGKQKKQKNKDTLREDVSVLLKILIREWDFFKDAFSQSDRGLVSELIEIRNQWAHQFTFSTDDTYRAVDSTLRLLKSLAQLTDVDQQLIDEVNKQRQDILRLLAQEQPRQETRVTSVSPAEEARIRERFRQLLERLPFRNAALLKQALIHTSYKYENPNTGEDNEQLEFLGDALLTFLSADFLYKRNPDLREGEMTTLRKNLVDNSRLAQFAEQLQLGQWMQLGKGEELSGGRTKPSLLSNAFEAVVGAYYLDSGIEKVRELVEPLFASVANAIPRTENTIPIVQDDPISELQRVVQRPNFANNPNRQVPDYSRCDRSGGTQHQPEFTCLVYLGDRELGSGQGSSKQEAKRKAAEDALRKLGRL